MNAPPSPTVGPRVRGAGGVEIATYHHGGSGPRLMLAHATGFHGRAWTPMASCLTDRFDVWSVDHRGHGSSGKAPDGRYDDWSLFVDDMLAVLETLGSGSWYGIGHSLGGAVLLLSEYHRPGTFISLCCFEPVVVPPSFMNSEGFDGRVPMSELARKRRSSFASKQEARDNYASKPPFSRFHPEALESYVEFGLVDAGDGTVTLACARDDEASVYEGAAHSGAWQHLGSIRPPTTILGGEDRGDPVSVLIEDVARHLPRGSALRVPGVTHFGPFEEPEKIAEIAAEALGCGALEVHHDRPTP